MGMTVFEGVYECSGCGSDVTFITTGGRSYAMTDDTDITKIKRHHEIGGAPQVVTCPCGEDLWIYLSTDMCREATAADLDLFRNIEPVKVSG